MDTNWKGTPEQQWNKDIIYGMLSNPSLDERTTDAIKQFVDSQNLDPALFDKDPSLFFHAFNPVSKNTQGYYFPYSFPEQYLKGKTPQAEMVSWYKEPMIASHVQPVSAASDVYVPLDYTDPFTDYSLLGKDNPANLLMHEVGHTKQSQNNFFEEESKIYDKFGGRAMWNAFIDNMGKSGSREHTKQVKGYGFIDNMASMQSAFVKPTEVLADFYALKSNLKQQGADLFNMGEAFDSDVFVTKKFKQAMKELLDNYEREEQQ